MKITNIETFLVDAGWRLWIFVDHPNRRGEEVVVGMPKLFVQRSHDQGRTWQRREWHVPGFSWLTAFPRWVRLTDGSILLPVYGRNSDGSRGQTFVFRSDPQGADWRLLSMAASIASVDGNKVGLIENGRTWDTANTVVLRNDGGAVSTLWPQAVGHEPGRGR